MGDCATQEALVRAALVGTHEQAPRAMVDLQLPSLVQAALQKGLHLLKPAAVLIPLVQRSDGLQVLLTVRAETMRNHKGQICFPGGRCDATDASFAACALREAWEEVALPPENCEVVGYLDDYPTVSSYCITPVVAIVKPPACYVSDPKEVASSFEVPLALFLERSSFQSKILSRDGINLPFYEIRYQHHRIWGATAGMLWHLHRVLSR